ncbi:transcriptional regulator, TetR family protein [Mycobacteroides abscessus 5S-0422]|uniref:Bacterial regulatory s, tetR family protein n=1 Tax=Mycobacteroides abscessus subsp. bolletii 1513 TaxID=1299321 RepID=X8DRX6_9MYCO|nr:TetR/AcrR family transcriptional regulator C-terminal domain-containing protein [Mycobacteroides abscessus]EUA70260.1 bacterial regulatory s, tetR family protein [Mycobacteroides abscessus subsp. bolletii 1513]EIU12455.1 transcriptional regulator, TetR family protein [Mycobacteroides abscessus 5S-0304]EIU14418.1 transcriptional regulator, TetR family protein [Mycobacteroides abscessus 5S-0421]EIU14873.1 transcriptional regulator, TetR family protein [Mycobacteroides abscessus 5S-0422]EIU271
MTQPPPGPSGHVTEVAGTGAEDNANRPITRAEILASALDIVDHQGIDALSMRRLAEALGRDPMALYRHVPNKAAVLDGVVEMVFEQLSLDTPATSWASALRKLGHDFRNLARAHPNVLPLLVTRPLATPLGMRPPGVLRHLEQVLALLTGAGFTGSDALHVYRALFGFLYGHVLTELQEIVERPEETDHVLRLGLHRLPIDQFPNLRELAPTWAVYDGEAELDRGLDILLSGLASRLGLPGDTHVPGPR